MSEKLLTTLNSRYSSMFEKSFVELGDVVLRVKREKLKEFFKEIKSDKDLKFDLFLSVTATDYLSLETNDDIQERFEVVYHLLSLENRYRLRIKVWLPETDLKIDTLSDLWAGANFMEREVWDMYGIRFEGHSDLRRILMYDEFKGFPLRKDYPLRGKQPRIRMLNPEVRNTAVDMQRPNLVKINSSAKRA